MNLAHSYICEDESWSDAIGFEHEREVIQESYVIFKFFACFDYSGFNFLPYPREKSFSFIENNQNIQKYMHNLIY